MHCFFFFQAEDGIRDVAVTGVQTCALPISPASKAAVMAFTPAAIRSRAKLITRMLLAVATPMHMIAPVSAGTESVVTVPYRIQTMPANAVGSAMTMTKGSIQD